MRGHPGAGNTQSPKLAIAEARALLTTSSPTRSRSSADRWLLGSGTEYDEFVGSVGDYVITVRRSGNPFYIALALSLDGSGQVLDPDGADEGRRAARGAVPDMYVPRIEARRPAHGVTPRRGLSRRGNDSTTDSI